MKTGRKFTAGVLSLLLTVPVFSLVASPQEGGQSQTDSEPQAVEEIVSRRGEFEKHYLMDDGTIKAVVYGAPVHHLVDGEWEEIDNSLTLQGGRYETGEYSAYQASFAQTAGGEEDLAAMEQDGYRLSWDISYQYPSAYRSAAAPRFDTVTVLGGSAGAPAEEEPSQTQSAILYTDA